MKRKKFEMEWFVYVYGLNCSGFRKMNIFDHFRFEECTIKHLKECSTKEEFAERISIASKFFLENDYAGVRESKESDANWLFAPKCKRTCYGVSYICVPRNGDAPYLFDTTIEDGFIMWESAKVVSAYKSAYSAPTGN